MKKIILWAALLIPFQANAILLEVDYFTEGDGLITYDNSTGLRWLDVRLTAGMSINQIEATDLMNSGWKWATTDQLITLYENNGLNFSLLGGNIFNNEAYQTLVDLLGPTYTTSYTNPFGELVVTNTIYGISRGFENPFGEGFASTLLAYETYDDEFHVGCGGDSCNSLPTNAGYNGSTIHDANFSQAFHGGMLIKEVPEPSSFALMGLGIAGLMTFRKRPLL